jgi:phage terminase small subunit
MCITREADVRRERFVDEYLIDHNRSRAAIAAGFAKSRAVRTAYELLRDPAVMAAIVKGETEAADRCGITLHYVLSALKENVERAMTSQPVLDKEGQPTGEYTYDGQVANKALEMLGKHLQMFTDKVDVTTNGEKLCGTIVFLPSGPPLPSGAALPSGPLALPEGEIIG